MASASVEAPSLAGGARSSRGRSALERLLAPADITIGGSRPWDVQIFDDSFYTKALPRGLLGIGEAYMDGWWDAEQLDEVACRILRTGASIPQADRLSLLLWSIQARLFNLQSRQRGREAARHHYDLGNDLFRAMLDKRMIYSCAYWKNARTLEEAQEAKLDLICRKVGLRPGMRVLDIGCGWGGFGRFAAENYGVSVVGITISEEQARLGRLLSTGLPVEIRVQDYRDLSGEFDAIVSIGMFEHVGHKNYRRFLTIVRQCLQPGGLFLLQTIGAERTGARGDPWNQKYIFPGGMVPSPQQVAAASEGVLVMEDWHNFGPDYDRTALAWFRNFHDNWPSLRDKYGDRFYRMWKYYLQMNAACFRTRLHQLWQIVLSRDGAPGGYDSIR